MNMTARAFTQPIDTMFTICFPYYTKTMLTSCVATKYTTNEKMVVILFMLLYF